MTAYLPLPRAYFADVAWGLPHARVSAPGVCAQPPSCTWQAAALHKQQEEEKLKVS